MDLDARRLKVLHEVSLRGSVTAAAAVLYISPSAVSQQLALLAKEAGCELVARNGRGVVLTPAGEVLARHAAAILASLDRAAAAVAAASQQVNGLVRVGSFPSAAGAVVAPAAAAAMAAEPSLDIRITESEDEPSLLDLRSGLLDVVLLQVYDHVPKPLPADLDEHPLFTDPMFLLTPTSWGCTGSSLADLADAVWVASYLSTPCGQSTLQACRDVGFEPDIRHRAIDFGLTIEMVAAGLGAALIPSMALPVVPEAVRFCRLTDPETSRRIFAVTRAQGAGPLRPAISALLDEMRRVRVPAPPVREPAGS
ncbi:LysR family transcriptional regulator [Nakamurella silvestris]|nr:LysR family transcriptional regulator [Nakamurella silvestris]